MLTTVLKRRHGSHVARDYSLRIGGVSFVMRTHGDIDLVFPDPSYDDFLGKAIKGACGDEEIRIESFFGRVPDVRGSLVFDSGQSWALFRDGNDFFLRFRRRGSEIPYMSARFDHDVANVEIYCSGEFVDPERKADNPFRYPLDQILLMHYLSARDGVIIHSAGFSLDGKGYLFPGWSGAGKSTISQKLMKTKALGLSDDRIVLRKQGESFMMFGTPWPGDAGIAVNDSVPLSGTFFLVQSGENRLERITNAEAFTRFIPVLSIQWFSRSAVDQLFSLVEKLISQVPSYILYFTPDIEVDFFEEFVPGQ